MSSPARTPAPKKGSVSGLCFGSDGFRLDPSMGIKSLAQSLSRVPDRRDGTIAFHPGGTQSHSHLTGNLRKPARNPCHHSRGWKSTLTAIRLRSARAPSPGRPPSFVRAPPPEIKHMPLTANYSKTYKLPPMLILVECPSDVKVLCGFSTYETCVRRPSRWQDIPSASSCPGFAGALWNRRTMETALPPGGNSKPRPDFSAVSILPSRQTRETGPGKVSRTHRIYI